MTQFNINQYQNIFFMGIAGSGMSAIAQYLAGTGKIISGSDRQFSSDNQNDTRKKLEAENIRCFPQDTSGIHANLDVVVVSAAIEPTVPEYQKALELGIPVVMRSDMLAAVAQSKKTIAVSGTSGKSTVTAMIFHILNEADLSPSLITGAGLTSLERQGKIGNSVTGTGNYLVIEADESDGSLVKYTPEIGLILNIDKDHKSLEELDKLFQIFTQNVQDTLIVNQSNARAAKFSKSSNNDFGYTDNAGFKLSDFNQNGFMISFKINGIPFKMNQIGQHNAENAAAASAAAYACGVGIEKSAEALRNYQGISRRNSLIGITKSGITVIDDYAHNPAKLSAAIKACQTDTGRLFIWFQPHGFGPTKFLRAEFVKEISDSLRQNDVVLMSDIYYAGGTADKSISSNDLITDIQNNNKNAVYIPKRENLSNYLIEKMQKGDILLLTGARDPSLGKFAFELFNKINEDA